MSNAPRIYVRGSYIDINENENVYLNIDKDGEVKTHIDEKQMQKTHRTLPEELPAELCTAEARTLHERLMDAGMMDDDWQPVGLSNAQKGLLTFYLAGKLDIGSQWKVFAALWGMNAETLRRAYNKALEQNRSLLFQDELKRILG